MNKITIVTDVDPHTQMVGGIFNYVRNISSQLKKHDFKIGLIGRIRSNSNKQIIHYDSFTGLKAKSNYTLLAKLLRFYFRSNNSDIIFAQRPDFLVPFLFKKGKKVIIYHGNPSRELFHKKGYFTGKIFTFLEKIATKKCDKIIVVSNETKEYLQEKYAVGSKTAVIPVGVDIDKFKSKDKIKLRKKYGFSPKDKIVLYIGRFSAEKQIDFIVEELSKLNIKLVLVGKGDVIKPKKNVIVMDPMPHSELPDMINCADCLVLFSKYEGMPTVVLESLACGKPVVSSDVGDVKNVIVNDKTGYIANKDNFAYYVKKILENPSKFKKACAKMASNYSWDKIAKKTIKEIA